MPVTARLSRLFYERLGEQIANELVDWFNAVDATYRSNLRDLNEQNFALFDAKLEQRLAELRGELRSDIAALRGDLQSDIAALRAELHSEIAALRTEVHSAIATLRGELSSDMASLRVETHGLKADLIKWMFGFWAVSLLTTLGGIAALARLLP